VRRSRRDPPRSSAAISRRPQQAGVHPPAIVAEFDFIDVRRQLLDHRPDLSAPQPGAGPVLEQRHRVQQLDLPLRAITPIGTSRRARTGRAVAADAGR
jgi:hypothetical protein